MSFYVDEESGKMLFKDDGSWPSSECPSVGIHIKPSPPCEVGIYDSLMRHPAKGNQTLEGILDPAGLWTVRCEPPTSKVTITDSDKCPFESKFRKEFCAVASPSWQPYLLEIGSRIIKLDCWSGKEYAIVQWASFPSRRKACNLITSENISRSKFFEELSVLVSSILDGEW